jgi:uncharacterized membrane protein
MPQRRESAEGSAMLMQQEVSFSTHMLPPKLLQEYNDIIPGFAQDVHNEFKTETAFRRSLNSWIVKGSVTSKFVGQVCAFSIAVFVLWIAWDLGVKGHDVLAGTIAVIDLAALVSVFLGTQYFGKEREQQAEAQNKEETLPE